MSFQFVRVVADTVNDAGSTRRVYLLAAGLVALGIALIVVTAWFWRSTRHDPELLAPLETMGGRSFRRLDGRARQQMLDSVRPAQAKPRRAALDPRKSPEVLDLRALDKTARPTDYDDLREDIVESARAAPAADPAARTVTGESEVRVGDSTAETAIDPLALIAAMKNSKEPPGGAEGAGPGTVSVLIVPMDHDLKEFKSTEGASSGKVVIDPQHEAGDGPSEGEGEGDAGGPSDPTSSIDPLLRKFDRDG